MTQYLSIQDVAGQLGVHIRTVRNYAAKFDWFGGQLGSEDGAPWVFTQSEVDRMKKEMASDDWVGRGRPRKPIGQEVNA